MWDRRKQDRGVLVSGSVHLDIISSVTEHEDSLDKKGELSIEVGGTGFNVAMNLQALGVERVFFHTALKDSPVSSVLAGALAATTQIIEYAKDLPQSGFSVHIKDGDMISAVSSTSIAEHCFESSKALREAVAKSRVAILDCNHHPGTLNMLADLCAAQNTPYAVCAVSEGKALRIPLLQTAPAFVFLNARERAYIKKYYPAWRPAASTTMIVTDGPRGADAFKGTTHFHVEAARLPETGPRVFLGAGDAFCAGFLTAIFFHEVDVVGALEQGRRAATEVISRNNCSTGAADLFDKHLATLNGKAERDTLTGLCRREPGERFLECLFERYRVGQTPTCVLFIDLDHFKQVNDSYGHAAGDAALIVAAGVIAGALRETDLAVRWGGEEFVAIVADCDLPGAVLVANRILAKLRSTVVPEIGRPVTASIGVAEIEPGDCPDRLLARGDAMLYVAKEEGRDCVRHTSS